MIDEGGLGRLFQAARAEKQKLHSMNLAGGRLQKTAASADPRQLQDLRLSECRQPDTAVPSSYAQSALLHISGDLTDNVVNLPRDTEIPAHMRSSFSIFQDFPRLWSFLQDFPSVKISRLPCRCGSYESVCG